MTSRYKITPIALSVHLESESPIYSENSFHVSVQDDASGSFLVLRSNGTTEYDKDAGFAIDFAQFEVLQEAVRILKESHE